MRPLLDTIKVCHVSPMDNLGGIENMVVDFLLQPNSQSFHHMLLCTSSKERVIQPLLDANKVIFKPARHIHYDPTVVTQMAKWMSEERVDIVHSYGAVGNTWGNMAAFVGKVRIYISSEHGTAWSIRPPTAWFDRWACLRANIVVANSQASAIMLQKRYGIPASKIRVVYNGVSPLPCIDTARVRSMMGFDDEQLIVGSVGRLDTPKHFSTFILAAAHVLSVRPKVHFVIVGGGPLEEELRVLINRLDIPKQFTITGWREDARQIVQIFDLFVSTSIRESFGNALVEAALAAKPIIAPRIDGIPEVVNDNMGILLQANAPINYPITHNATPRAKWTIVDGRICPPRSIEVGLLAETILYLLDRPDLRREYGFAGRQHATNNFSIQRYSEALQDIYRKADQNNSSF
jgi:glycosyltransferase involved in cell wall biosynthesis